MNDNKDDKSLKNEWVFSSGEEWSGNNFPDHSVPVINNNNNLFVEKEFNYIVYFRGDQVFTGSKEEVIDFFIKEILYFENSKDFPIEKYTVFSKIDVKKFLNKNLQEGNDRKK